MSRFGRRISGVALPAAIAVGALVLPSAASAKPVDVKVMTRNLYLGANLLLAIAAPNPPAMAAAGDIYRSVIDTNFTARAKLLARARSSCSAT